MLSQKSGGVKSLIDTHVDSIIQGAMLGMYMPAGRPLVTLTGTWPSSSPAVLTPVKNAKFDGSEGSVDVTNGAQFLDNKVGCGQ